MKIGLTTRKTNYLLVSLGQNFDSKIRRDHKKKKKDYFEHRIYESVDDTSLFFVISQNQRKTEFRH